MGWKVLDRLDIDPLSNEFLDPDALPPDLEEIRQREPGGVNSERFKAELQFHRESNMDFFRDLRGTPPQGAAQTRTRPRPAGGAGGAGGGASRFGRVRFRL